MSDPVTLANVDKHLFDRVWALMRGLEDREKHFNELQSRYRTLASTWLLAAFAGIGFVFSTSLTTPVSTEVVAAAMALAGATGIMLLWVLDVVVYHDLLIAGYVAGQHLENLFQWLPPVRTNFAKLAQEPVRWYIAAFYMSGISILCFIAAVSCWFWQGGYSGFLAAIVLFALVLDVVIVVWTRRALERKGKLPPWRPG